MRMGIPGVEYFAHPYEFNPCIAKEFLFLGNKLSAQRAYEIGMLNQVQPLNELEASTFAIAERIAHQPRLGLALTKQAINHIENLQGKRNGIEAAFAWHHFAHSHNELLSGNNISGYDAATMSNANKKDSGDDSP